MTTLNRHQGPDSEKGDLIEIIGDEAATQEANREIFLEVNTVRAPGSSAVNVAATSVKRAAAKAVVQARRK
jgi:hypothetical protein